MYIILAGVISLIVTLIAGKLLIPALVKLITPASIIYIFFSPSRPAGRCYPLVYAATSSRSSMCRFSPHTS